MKMRYVFLKDLQCYAYDLLRQFSNPKIYLHIAGKINLTNPELNVTRGYNLSRLRLNQSYGLKDSGNTDILREGLK